MAVVIIDVKMVEAYNIGHVTGSDAGSGAEGEKS